MSRVADSEEPEKRVHDVLEQGLEQVETPETAHAVLDHVEQLSGGDTEAERGGRAARETAGAVDPPEAAAHCVERAAAAPAAAPEAEVANVLDAVAAQAVAPSTAAEPVVTAAQSTLNPNQPVTPAARRGRQLLKDAALRRMGPLDALDARVYLAVNEAPHPGVLDSLAWIIALVFTGGWCWLLATLVAYLLRVPNSPIAIRRLVPSLIISTWLIEYPIKRFFRRRRPFVRIVEALVIGKKPGSWSFPSGHTGASFASAWILSTVWPKRAPIFFGLAGLVGFSRVYVGAHYPGDVTSGAVLGLVLSELVRRVLSHIPIG